MLRLIFCRPPAGAPPGLPTKALVLSSASTLFDPAGAAFAGPPEAAAHVMSAAGPRRLRLDRGSGGVVGARRIDVLIDRPDALPVILETLAGRAGGITMLPFIPGARPRLFGFSAREKGSRAPLWIARPLFLHDGKGFTPAAEAIHRGNC